MNMPTIKDIEAAVRIYNSTVEIGNKEIRAIFGKMETSRLKKFREIALAEMIRRECPQMHPFRVNTIIAFEAWGYDIKELERKYMKLKRLGFAS